MSYKGRSSVARILNKDFSHLCAEENTSHQNPDMPRKRQRFVLPFLIALVLASVAYGALHASISAAEEPGKLETYAATKAKRWLVARGARQAAIHEPAMNAADVAAGEMVFRGECEMCHSADGRTPADLGRALYPPAPGLASPAVQDYSDPQLFWIIRVGIRLSGMPGFGKTHSDKEIWSLVQYIRSLPQAPQGRPKS